MVENIAITDRGGYFYVKENNDGSINSDEVFTSFRFTGGNLSSNKETNEGDEISPDRNPPPFYTTSRSISGDINMILSKGTYDEFFKTLLRTGAWSTPVDITGTDIAATATGFTSTSTDFTAQNIIVGQHIMVSGFTNTAINGVYRITVIATNELTVEIAPPATEAAGPSITMYGSFIRNGQDRLYNNTFRFVKAFTDVHINSQFTRCAPASFTLNMDTSDAIRGTWSFVGEEELGMNSKFTTATDISATATGFASTSTDFTTLDLVVGEYILVKGFATAAINGYYKVDAVTANTITTVVAPSAIEAAGLNVTVYGATYQLGTSNDEQILNCVYNVGNITEGARVMVDNFPKRISITFNDNSVVENYIGDRGYGLIRDSRLTITGEMETLLQNDEFIQKVQSENRTSLGVTITANDRTPMYNIFMPNLFLQTHDTNPDTANEATKSKIPFNAEAIGEGDEKYAFQITKFFTT